MDELAFNKQYHIAYVLGTEFETRMFNVYVGLGTGERPPFLEDIFTETLQMQALIFLESIREAPEKMNLRPAEWKELHEKVWHNDDHAKLCVLDRVSGDELDNVVHDIFYYLNKYRLSALTKRNDSLYSHQAKLLNSPLKEVW